MENSDPSFSGGDFGFAFNNVKFSDRLLRIEITCAGSEVSCSSNVDLVKDDRKRRRQDHSQTHPHGDLNKNWCDLNKSWCETNYENNNNNKHEETMVITERASSQSGGEDESEFYNWGRINNASILRVKELHISSAILASKSPFFYKLFSNGMLESEQKHMSLKIDVSEEAAVMELLYFMYSNLLTVTTASALLDVLMAADKFEVASCMKYCSRLLLDMPMTLDSALLFLGLPPSLQTADSVKPLTIAARQFIASRYKDITKCLVEEVIALPLVGIEAILASDDLQIPSEDILYEVVLKWAKTHYSVLEERQEILGSHLARYIRFPHMTCHRLKKILASNDFRPSVASKLVLEALFFKAESLHHRRVLAPEQPASINHSFVGRSYKYRPIKVVEFEAPLHQCIVYLDLKRKECEALHPSDRIYSQTFHLGGQGFNLSAHHNMDQLNMCHSFGLFLGTEGKGTVSLTVDYNFSARWMPTKEFVEKFKGNYKFTAGKAVGCRNVFTRPWEMFIGKDCPYFINDVLHLRAELSIRL